MELLKKMMGADKPEIMKSVLTVKDKLYLSPHYIRVVLHGNMSVYAQARVGDNNKIIVPQADTNTVVLPDFRSGRGGNNVLMRTYTLRHIDLENNLMTIDFVAHGDEGPASGWAISAAPGDKLGVLMKSKSKPLFIPSEYYVFAGDHTAVPVISVMLEQLPATAKGKAILEVYSPEDVLTLKKPENVDVVWVFNNTPGQKTNLVTPVKNNPLLNEKDVYVFVAAEQAVVQEIQFYLRNTSTLKREQWQALSYWKYGVAEDASSGERRQVSRS